VKNNLLAYLAVAVVSVGLSASAFAEAPKSSQYKQTLRAGIRATFSAYYETRMELAGGILDKLAKRNLDVLISEGCDRLRTVGEFDLAAQLEQEWTQQVSGMMTTRLAAASSDGIGTLELGDFEPVSAWLDNFYNTLYYKTKGLVKGVRVIHDVYLMNYALAVILRPNGNWRLHTAYDRIEYRKHFIPFANTVTFWASVKACEYYLPQVKKYCANGSSYLERFMGKHIAPHLSDSVFSIVTHGQTNAPAPVVQDLDYQAFENLMTSDSSTATLLEE
jgi:hypothetical protein